MCIWNSLAFPMVQRMLAIWSLVPLPLLKPAWTFGSSQFTYYWSLAWRILSITLLACEMSAIVWYFEHSLVLPFFGIEWKLTFSSPVATAEFSKFAGILSAALSQHHLSGFEIAQLEFHHLHYLCSSWCFLRHTWLQIPGCLALGEWSHHQGHLGLEDIFCIVILCILATSS